MKNNLRDSGVLFDDSTHTYWFGEKQLFGITGMIGRQLFPGKYSNVPDYIMKNAAERGERIHNECFTNDMFGTAESNEAKWYAELKKKEGFKVIESEYIVTDGDYFATPIDKVLTLKKDLCLGDIKTTYTLDKEYLSWQLSVNAFLFELQNPGLKVKNLFAIYIRNGAQFIEIDRKPNEVVKSLLEAEKNGEQFQNPYALVVSDKDNEKALALVRELAEIAETIKQLEDIKKVFISPQKYTGISIQKYTILI